MKFNLNDLLNNDLVATPDDLVPYRQESPTWTPLPEQTQPMPQNEQMAPEKKKILENYLKTKSMNAKPVQSPAMKQPIVEQPTTEEPQDNKWAQLAAGMGAALAGRGPNEALQFFENQKKLAYDKEQNKLMLAEKALARKEAQKQQEIDNAFREKQLSETINSRKEIAALNRQAQGAAKQEKVAEKQNKQQMSMNEVNDRYVNIKDGVAKLKAMVDAKGTQEVFGPHNKNMDQYIQSIATDMAKLVDPNSVARESEVDSFKKMLFEPGFWQQESTVQGVLDNFANMVDKRLENAYSIRGLEMPAQVKEAKNQKDPRVENFMKKNNISDYNEAVNILKKHGKL